MAPVATNAQRHPHVTVTHGTTIGASTTPTFVPALKIPVANARSFFGNHSATVLTAPGKLPASPRPSASRARLKPETVLTAAWPMHARLQTITDREYADRVPIQSKMRPVRSRPNP